MSSPLIGGRELQAKVLIWRVGDSITIKRPDGSETENMFGKKDDTDLTFDTVSTVERGYRFDPSRSNSLRAAVAVGGRADMHEPHVALGHDTEAQEDDLLEFPDLTYHVTKVASEGSYKAAKTALYSG